jgi:hypothetical protein
MNFLKHNFIATLIFAVTLSVALTQLTWVITSEVKRISNEITVTLADFRGGLATTVTAVKGMENAVKNFKLLPFRDEMQQHDETPEPVARSDVLEPKTAGPVVYHHTRNIDITP